jgi:hypothetical protein
MNKARWCCLVCAGLLDLVLLPPCPAEAGWPTDPLENVPLCTAAGNQNTPAITSDGTGGAIVTWYDYRSGNARVYAQRISAGGAIQWAADGVALCTASGAQVSPTIVSDGAGGALIAWVDSRSGNSDIYAQRITAAGAIQWTADGAALCTAVGTQNITAIDSDGAGGAIVTWQDSRGGVLTADIYAQRISAAGAVQWTADGVAICATTQGQYTPAIVSDGSGWAIVAWVDDRSGNLDIYAQRISAAGVIQWAANGVALCVAPYDQRMPAIVSDGTGGAIVTWSDLHLGISWDIYAQRISSTGAIQWAANGVPLCSNNSEQVYPAIASDGASGAIVAWQDARGGNYDIYAQRISAAGAVQWTANGVSLCTAAGSQEKSRIVTDGVGGAIVTWHDYRSGSGNDVYAQRISAAGAAQWTVGGVALCTATGDQNYPALVSDGAAGAIVSWYDGRNGTGNGDIYAQRVLGSGQLGGDVADVPGEVAIAFALEPVRPNPSYGVALTARFTLASAAPASLDLVDVAGRRVAMRDVGSWGAGRHVLELGADLRLSPGLYLMRLRQGADMRVTRVVVLR